MGITVNQKSFITLKDACDFYNKNYSVTKAKIYKLNYSIEEAFGFKNRDENSEKIKIEDNEFLFFEDACIFYNKDIDMAKHLLYAGFPLKEIFDNKSITNIKNNCKPITVRGKRYESLSQACAYYHLNSQNVRQRLKKGWSVEEAFELVKRKRNVNGKEITVNSRTFETTKEACKYFNLNYNAVMNRLHKGWTLEEAFELVKRDGVKGTEITVEGKTFISIAEAARYYNLNVYMVSQRLNILGWSIEEAFELVPRKRKRKK